MAAQAGQLAADSLAAAHAAEAALDAELKAQQSAWFKSYDKARELALAVKTAADKATADAVAARERAEALAAKEKADAEAREALRASARRVGGRIRAPVKIKDVAPIYPAIARSARASGSVEIEATIGTDGRIVDARVVRSVPLLDQAALDAVRRWEYSPSLLNGRPVPVTITVTVNFQP